MLFRSNEDRLGFVQVQMGAALDDLTLRDPGTGAALRHLLVRIFVAQLVEVEALSDSARGAGGFGSTGTHVKS